MVGELICVAAVALGIDVGWQRLPEGGTEYLIQLEPEVLDTLREGAVIQSDVPPSLGTIRAYRISVGNAELPREAPPEAETADGGEPPAEEPNRSESLLEPSTGSLPPRGPGPSLDMPWPTPGGLGPAREESLGTADGPAAANPPPQFLPEEPQRKPLEAEAAVFHSPEAGSEQTSAETGAGKAEQADAKPWAPLLLTLFGLFASLGGNLYLGWLALDFRGRYRRLLAQETG